MTRRKDPDGGLDIPGWNMADPGPARFRVPELLRRLSVEPTTVEAPGAGPGERLWVVPTHNAATNYDMVVSESADYVTLETELDRAPAPSERLYGVLFDIDARTIDGHIVVERDVPSGSEDAATCDAIYFTKHIRKRGVPSTTILQEVLSFDNGVARVFPEVKRAVEFELLHRGSLETPGHEVRSDLALPSGWNIDNNE